LANDNVVKLIDFGNATRISDFHGTSGGGSPAFMAPESLGKG
jgi:serine/threonine protein kinase